MARTEPTRRRTINCDFFRVHMPPGYVDFGTCLKDVFTRQTSISERNYRTEDGFWRIEGLSVRPNGCFSGVFVNLRTTADARVGSEDTEGLSELNLGEGRALAEFCCFIFHPEFHTLVVHRNRYAGGYARIEFYAAHVLNCPEIRFGLIINQDSLARLARMEYKQRLEVAISNPANLSHVAQNESARRIASIAADGDVQLMNLTMSASNRRQGLADSLVNSITSLVRSDESQVKTARVRGRLDNEMVIIDLIKDRMQEVVEVQLSGPRISLEEVIWALEQAYSRRQREIERQFTEPEA